jgi:hypothetical protein
MTIADIEAITFQKVRIDILKTNIARLDGSHIVNKTPRERLFTFSSLPK